MYISSIARRPQHGAQVHDVIMPELMEGVISKRFSAISALTPAD
jgi:hypothetical protein